MQLWFLGGAAVHRCDNCVFLNAALAAEGAALAQKGIFRSLLRYFFSSFGSGFHVEAFAGAEGLTPKSHT